MFKANKHVMVGVDGDDGGTVQCLGCRQYVYGSMTESPPGECPTPYKSPEELLAEALAREATLREELAGLHEELSEEFADEERTPETLQEAIAWLKTARDDNKSRWLAATERLKLQGITIRVGADREAALRRQLAKQTTWSDVQPWYEANEQMLRDVFRFEGLRGAALEVWRAAVQAAPVVSERDQGIPGTSFQRLNQLANQGE